MIAIQNCKTLVEMNYFFLFSFQPSNAQIYIYIYHNTVSLYNVQSYKFRHVRVILRESQKFVPLLVTYLVQAACFCGCRYSPLLLLLVCWSGVY